MKPIGILLLACSIVAAPAGDSTTHQPTTTDPSKPTDAPKNAKPICEICTCKNQTKLLDCSNRKLKIWPTDNEWKQINATFNVLRFDHNDFEEVKQFPALNVTHLYLNNNKLVKIAQGAFMNLQQLVVLDLSYNNFTSQNLKAEAFEGQYSTDNYEPIAHLKELNLAYNDLHTLDQDMFMHFPVLEKLSLNNNVFKLIDHQTIIAISSIATLKYLDLSYTEIREIPESIFHAPRSLTVLNITGNLLTKIPSALAHAINLEELYMNENPLEDFTGKNVFPLLQRLEKLSLAETETIKKIGKEAFGELPALKELNMEGCLHLAEIDSDAFSRPDENGRKTYPPVQKLNFRRNNISSFEKELLARWDTVTLNITGNPLDCQCENEWLLHDQYPYIRDEDPAAARELKCVTPKFLTGTLFEDIYKDKNILRCPDAYGNRPENDGLLLMGMLIGLLIGMPIVMGIFLLWKRGCFGLVATYPHEHSRALYKRAELNDDYQ